jgi:hypothetical protein
VGSFVKGLQIRSLIFFVAVYFSWQNAGSLHTAPLHYKAKNIIKYYKNGCKDQEWNEKIKSKESKNYLLVASYVSPYILFAEVGKQTFNF